ncbi:hypothetical protein N9L68_00765 [bacterium]|nr:hypothetical protein [bacterium]
MLAILRPAMFTVRRRRKWEHLGCRRLSQHPWNIPRRWKREVNIVTCHRNLEGMANRACPHKLTRARMDHVARSPIRNKPSIKSALGIVEASNDLGNSGSLRVVQRDGL